MIEEDIDENNNTNGFDDNNLDDDNNQQQPAIQSSHQYNHTTNPFNLIKHSSIRPFVFKTLALINFNKF